MPLNATVQRGFTATSGTPVSNDDLNAGFLPTVDIEGAVGSSDLGAGSTNSTHIVPGPIAYALTTGSANAYVAAPNPAVTALVAGVWLLLRLSFTNTGAATLNVNSLGAKALKKLADQDVEAGDLRSGAIVEVRYDGTNWQLAEPGLPDRLYGELGGAINTYTTTLAGVSIGDVSDLTGRLLVLKVGAALTNTGASTLNVNGLGAVSVRAPDGAAVTAGALTAGRFVAVTFDGSNWQLLNSTSFTLPSVGPGAGAIAYPASITLDANGRVTAATAGTAPAGTVRAMAVFDGTVSTSTKPVSAADATADTVTLTGHGWSTGQLVWFDAPSLTVGGVTANTPYYAQVIDANTVKLYTEAARTNVVNISSTGAATGTARFWASSPFSGTPNNIDGIILDNAQTRYFVDFTTPLGSANYVVPAIATALAGGPAYAHHPFGTTPGTGGFWIGFSVPSVGDVASPRIALEVVLLA
jgi:hypothetical protein